MALMWSLAVQGEMRKITGKRRIFSFHSKDISGIPSRNVLSYGISITPTPVRGDDQAFPISNWTELDIWQYLYAEQIPIVPFTAGTSVVRRDETWILVDDDRIPLEPGEEPEMKQVRFRTLGCYPLTGAIESSAITLEEIIAETINARSSERQERLIDSDQAGSMEKKKQEGYF